MAAACHAGSLVAVPRPDIYVERRTDGYRVSRCSHVRLQAGASNARPLEPQRVLVVPATCGTPFPLGVHIQTPLRRLPQSHEYWDCRNIFQAADAIYLDPHSPHAQRYMIAKEPSQRNSLPLRQHHFRPRTV